METKLNSEGMEKIRRHLKFIGCFTVESLGRKGGLALLWKNDDQVKIQNYSHGHISAWIMDNDHRDPWFFTDFYGEPNTNKRSLSWSLLNQLKPNPIIPWLISRDFNEILFYHEKRGGHPRSDYLMQNFILAMESCKL